MSQTGNDKVDSRLGAVVLAAGRSTRMGQPKQLLPWGERTVIEQVVFALHEGGVGEIVVATGAVREQVADRLRGYPVLTVFNPDFATAEMLTSLKVGIRALGESIQAMMVVLGDQPGIKAETVRAVADAYRQSRSRLVVPSYQMRRGHPWLLDRSLWPDLLALPEDKTLRDFLQTKSAEIHYVEVDTPTILKDVDTPEDYHQQRPK